MGLWDSLNNVSKGLLYHRPYINQFSHSVVSDSLRLHGLHQLPELAQTQVHLVSDAIPASIFQSFPASGSFPKDASIFPSIRVFSNQSVLHIMWPKYWSFSFNISPSNEYSGLISFRIHWFDFLAVCKEMAAKGLSRVFSNTTVQKHQFSGTQLSL